MITQNQYPFAGEANANNSVMKVLIIGVVVVGILAGIYFTIKAKQEKGK